MRTHALNVSIQCVSAMNVEQRVNDSSAFEIKALAGAIVSSVRMVSMVVHMVGHIQSKTMNLSSMNILCKLAKKVVVIF
jgi:hypothetical protein